MSRHPGVDHGDGLPCTSAEPPDRRQIEVAELLAGRGPVAVGGRRGSHTLLPLFGLFRRRGSTRCGQQRVVDSWWCHSSGDGRNPDDGRGQHDAARDPRLPRYVARHRRLKSRTRPNTSPTQQAIGTTTPSARYSKSSTERRINGLGRVNGFATVSHRTPTPRRAAVRQTHWALCGTAAIVRMKVAVALIIPAEYIATGRCTPS